MAAELRTITHYENPKKMKEENWKPVVGYDGYEVSDIGNVKSLPKKKGVSYLSGNSPEMLLKNNLGRNGYNRVNMGRNKMKMIHRLVAETFIPNPENKKCVNHKNGIKTDNHVENLEWVTHAENVQHSVRTGLKANTGATKRKIKCESTGKIFNSYVELATELNIGYNTLMSRFRQGYKNHNYTVIS